MTKEEKLKDLYDKNGLEKEDIFILELGGKKVPIITRTGIEKIAAKNNISIVYEIISHNHKEGYFIIKGIGKMNMDDGKNPIKTITIESFGECSPENNKQKYPLAISEKRCMSRVVLKLAGLYELGVFGQDESEDFKQK